MTGAIATSLTNPTLHSNWIFIIEIRLNFPSLGRKSLEIFLSLKHFYPCDGIVSIPVREIFHLCKGKLFYPCDWKFPILVREFFLSLRMNFVCPRERIFSIPRMEKWCKIFFSWNGNSKKLQPYLINIYGIHVD